MARSRVLTRVPEFFAFAHLLVCRSAIVVRSHQRRKNSKSLAGDHARVSTRDLAIGRRKHDAMAA
jgi:hypothetical protein